MRNIALTLRYLGTAYHGWQVQKNDITVGQTLEKAAAMVVGHKVHITGCGRTDAGVHAKVYVANFRTDARIPVDRIPYAFNTHLPGDIVVTGAMEVHDGFNAIGSCVKKEYTYLIYNSPIKDPFYVNRAWFYPKHLDETVMQRAAQQRIRAERFRRVRGTIGSHFAFRREKMRKRGSLRFIERTIEPDSIQPDIHTFRPLCAAFPAEIIEETADSVKLSPCGKFF